jgi:restriction system protein
MREVSRLYRQWALDQHQETEEVADQPSPEAAATLEEAEEAAWTEIEEFLEKMSPYDFEELVAGLLRGMGYYVGWVSPPGPDRGIDVIAHTDPLGIQGPRIKVQVKRRGDKTAIDGVRSLLALLGEEDVGLFVSMGGFTREAEDEARRQEKRRVMLVDLKRLFDLWVEHYERIPEVQRRLLPIRPVYFLIPAE